MLEKLLRAGVDAFRVNMSHGEHAVHAETIAAIRALERKASRPITVLCDLQGPKLRVGKFKEGRAVIRHSGHFTLDRNPEPGDETRVQLPHPELFGILKPGQRLLIDDGKLRLRVIRADDNEILCSAEVGGVISDRQGRQRARRGDPGSADDRQGPRRPRLRGQLRCRTGSRCPSCSAPRTSPRRAA
jgi:pyruvate kinase